MKIIASLALLGSALLLNSCGTCEDCKNGACAVDAAVATPTHNYAELSAVVAAAR